MSSSVAGPRARWHPGTGAALVAGSVALPVLAAVVLLTVPGATVPPPWGGASAFLVMGAVAGFSVSGST